MSAFEYDGNLFKDVYHAIQQHRRNAREVNRAIRRTEPKATTPQLKKILYDELSHKSIPPGMVLTVPKMAAGEIQQESSTQLLLMDNTNDNTLSPTASAYKINLITTYGLKPHYFQYHVTPDYVRLTRIYRYNVNRPITDVDSDTEIGGEIMEGCTIMLDSIADTLKTKIGIKKKEPNIEIEKPVSSHELREVILFVKNSKPGKIR